MTTDVLLAVAQQFVPVMVSVALFGVGLDIVRSIGGRA